MKPGPPETRATQRAATPPASGPLLSLGFSPCPNDTFIFHALVHGRVDAAGLHFDARLADVETLNRLAELGELDVAKVSYGIVPRLLDEYVLLRSGGALGRGCGPLLVGRPGLSPASLDSARLAIPGRRTTANLLLRLWRPELREGREMVYSEIMPAVVRGEVDAGLIIHESRFTYPEHGLHCVLDLGAWWEAETGLPLPLGAIVARRSLGEARIARLEAAIRASAEHAARFPAESQEYVRTHAREMSDGAIAAHIALYVNEYSLDLGSEGEQAVAALLNRAAQAGLAPAGAAVSYTAPPV